MDFGLENNGKDKEIAEDNLTQHEKYSVYYNRQILVAKNVYDEGMTVQDWKDW